MTPTIASVQTAQVRAFSRTAISHRRITTAQVQAVAFAGGDVQIGGNTICFDHVSGGVAHIRVIRRDGSVFSRARRIQDLSAAWCRNIQPVARPSVNWPDGQWDADRGVRIYGIR